MGRVALVSVRRISGPGGSHKERAVGRVASEDERAGAPDLRVSFPASHEGLPCGHGGPGCEQHTRRRLVTLLLAGLGAVQGLRKVTRHGGRWHAYESLNSGNVDLNGF